MRSIHGRRASSLAAAAFVVAIGAFAASAPASAAALDPADPTVKSLTDYVQSQKTTGFLLVKDGELILERNWPAPAGSVLVRSLFYGTTSDGALLEDVASQQKSFVSFLVAVAIDKGLIDVSKPVSAYVGQGWSKATPAEESRIRVLDVLTMSSGLDEQFAYAAPPGTAFFYNTPVYAITKKVLAAVAHQSLSLITRDWLTGPAGMEETSWRDRPAAMAAVGDSTGLVSSPRDAAKLVRSSSAAASLGLDGDWCPNRLYAPCSYGRAKTRLRPPLVAEWKLFHPQAARSSGRWSPDTRCARRSGRGSGGAGP